MEKKRSIRSSAAALVLGLAMAGLSAPALSAVSQSEAAKMVAESFGVQVLRVRPGQVGERRVWLVTVMNRGGDFNSAFQVNTLAVDQGTGELVPAFRHRSSGYDLPAAAPGSERRDGG